MAKTFLPILKVLEDYLNIFSFVAEEDIEYGKDPTEIIEYNLKECKYLVLILTITAFKSLEVKNEFFKAKEMNKNIIPCVKVGLEDYFEKEFKEIELQYTKFESKEDLACNVLEIILKKEIKEQKNTLRRLK